MKSLKLWQTLQQYPRPYYRLVDLKKITQQSQITTSKSAARLVEQGLLERWAKDVYVVPNQVWAHEKVATQLYQPSAVSLESVLFAAGVINQPPFILTLVTPKHSKKIELGGLEVEYTQLKSDLWWGLELKSGFYQMNPEKAVAEMLYLRARSQRFFTTDEWELGRLNQKKLTRILGRVGVEIGPG